VSRFITHPRFMDVFIEVVKITYSDEKRVKCKIRWWNGGYRGQNPFPLWVTPENHEFTREKYKEFVSYLGKTYEF
jgi:hypothetical protein